MSNKSTVSRGNSKPKRPHNWSLTKLQCYEQCPLQFKFRFLDKIPEGPPGPALARGSEIHDNIEHYLKGGHDELTSEAHRLLPFIDTIKELVQDSAKMEELNVGVELKLAVDKDWEPCDWKDRNAWLRLVFDCVVVTGVGMQVIDWKTGKVYRDKHEDQLHLYNTAALSAFPNLIEAIGLMAYTDVNVKDGEEVQVSLKREELAMAKKMWEDRVQPMFRDTNHAPRQGYYCKWCNFSKDKGGPCPL